MSTRPQTIVVVGLLASAAVLLYGFRLGSPTPLRPTEIAFVEQARSVAADGHDFRGRAVPLFFQVDDTRWLQPIAVYCAALALAVAPASDFAARWPSVMIGAIDVALIYLVARRAYRREWLAILAAVLLLATPSHFVYSRLAVDSVYPVPFVLGWLMCVSAFVERPRLWLVFVAALCLGVGVYADASAPITMAALVLITGASLWLAGHRASRLYLAMLAGFALPLLCLPIWYALHPSSYGDTMGRWAVHLAHVRNPLDGFRAFINWNTLSTRSALYWDFYNPATLFLSGGADARDVMNGAAPFLLPLAALAPVGVWRSLGSGPRTMGALLVAGVVAAPLAASTFGEPHAIGRALVVVPFVTLVAVDGVAVLLGAARLAPRVLGAVLLVLVPVQFALFYGSAVRLP